jgi:hypothetical protein
MQLWPDIT